uniref:Zinc finger and BTB domain-containing protein 32 n=1 Tax=Phascolarctos cinereus TaxID=38626 RepID=A0A6P5IZR7_PHACI|nr:zinc finger and BTB domain-containing protein 32 [Phascolarctos cinereus]
MRPTASSYFSPPLLSLTCPEVRALQPITEGSADLGGKGTSVPIPPSLTRGWRRQGGISPTPTGRSHPIPGELLGGKGPNGEGPLQERGGGRGRSPGAEARPGQAEAGGRVDGEQEAAERQPHCKGTPSPGPGARRTSLTLEASCCCLQGIESPPPTAPLSLKPGEKCGLTIRGSLQLGTALPSSNEKKISDQRSSEGEKPFSCHLCPQCSQDISAMTKHLRTHGPAPHCCPLCQAGSPSVAATQAHIRSHPPGQLPGWTMQSTFLSSSSRPPLPPLLGPPENRILQPL